MKKWLLQKITVDKREITDFTKLPSTASFIGKPSAEILSFAVKEKNATKVENEEAIMIKQKLGKIKQVNLKDVF